MKLRAGSLACSLVLAFLSVWASPARADVWGYVDERGVSHLASEKIDDRYELFFKSAEIPILSGRGKAATSPAAAPRNAAVPSKLVTFFDISPSYKQVKHHLREASFVHGVDYELLQAVIATESGFDPQAVSPKGAIGLMQVMPATGQRFGVTADKKTTVEQKLTDPKTNIRAGSRYLVYLLKLFPGQLDLAIAAYNAGEGAVRRAGNKVPRYPETQNYVKTVMQLYAALKPSANLGQLPARALGGSGGPAGGRIRVEMAAPMGGRSSMPTRSPADGSDGAGGMVKTPSVSDVVVRGRGAPDSTTAGASAAANAPAAAADSVNAAAVLSSSPTQPPPSAATRAAARMGAAAGASGD